MTSLFEPEAADVLRSTFAMPPKIQPPQLFEELMAHESQYPQVQVRPARTPDATSIADGTLRPTTSAKENGSTMSESESRRPYASAASALLELQTRHLRKPSEAFAMEVGEPLDTDQTSAKAEDDSPAPLPDISRRGIHIPTRTSSSSNRTTSRHRETATSLPATPESRERSSVDSLTSSYETQATSMSILPPLQEYTSLGLMDRLEPLAEDDPRSFDLLAPLQTHNDGFSLERRSVQMFSREHLQAIFAEPSTLLKFTTFLSIHRQQSIPILIYYLDAIKALKAINYANAVAEALEPIEGFEFTEHPARPTVNSVLEDKANQAFDALVREDLPAYITHTYVQIVSLSIQRRITGTLAPHLREASEGLAEVFCISDPSRTDNPIVFASEEFHRTTQYGVKYAIGRNCRFLQGPRTNPFSMRRIREALEKNQEHSEVFLNYRRDGSPFMNLLMIAPLFDSRGVVRYYIGAQVDVSGLVKECTDLEGLQRMLEKEDTAAAEDEQEKKDEFKDLAEMFNTNELETVRKHGGRMHTEQEPGTAETTNEKVSWHRPRLLLKENSPDLNKSFHIDGRLNGKLSGVYQHYLLLRPHPSLRILFTSPSLRVPGIPQSPFMSRIGGSPRVREELSAALAEGRGVTAKVRWISRADDEGRARWIHCTPLLGHTGKVGVWMVVLVDEEHSQPVRRFRKAPPVPQGTGNAQEPEKSAIGAAATTSKPWPIQTTPSHTSKSLRNGIPEEDYHLDSDFSGKE